MSLGDGVTGGGQIVDPAGMDDRQIDRATDAPGDLEVRCSGHPHGRHPLRQAEVVVGGPGEHVEEIEPAVCRQPLRDLHAVPGPQAPLGQLVARHADTDDEARTHCRAYRIDHLQGQSQAVVERAAILVRAPVHQR